MSKPQTGAGDVKVTLDGEEVALVPTLRACQTISRDNGGIIGAINRAAQFDIDTITLCVALGLNKAPAEVADKVWSTGLAVLAPKVMEWLSHLANGGRPRTGGSEGTDDPR